MAEKVFFGILLFLLCRGGCAEGGQRVQVVAVEVRDVGVAAFDSPFRLVTTAADEIERRLTGTDVH